MAKQNPGAWGSAPKEEKLIQSLQTREVTLPTVKRIIITLLGLDADSAPTWRRVVGIDGRLPLPVDCHSSTLSLIAIGFYPASADRFQQFLQARAR